MADRPDAPKWHTDARTLAAAGWTNAEIGRLMGRSRSAVLKALRPDAARAYNQQTINRRRADVTVRERKRETDRAYVARRRAA